MKIGVITSLIVSIVLSLAVSANAMRDMRPSGQGSPDKGYIGTLLGMATTDASRITNHGGGSVRIVRTPSVVSGFEDPICLYIEAKDEAEARTTASEILAYGIKNLTARVWAGSMKASDLKAKIETEKTSGREGMSDSYHSSDSSSYSSNGRRSGPYHSSNSSSGGSNSGMDATSIYIRSSFSLENGQKDIIPVRNIPVGGADTSMTNQRSSDYGSSSRSYSYRRGSSSDYHSSSSSNSTYRSPEVGQAMMKDKIARDSRGNLAALIVDAITNAALSGQIPGGIFQTYQSPQPDQTAPAPQEGQNISAPLR